jgi:hypothetical protein
MKGRSTVSDLAQDTRPIQHVRPMPHGRKGEPRHHITGTTEVRHLAARYLPDGEHFQRLARTLAAS